jgi:hypothetical protein
VNDWEERVAQAWASIDDYGGREDEFRALIDSLAAELPDDMAIRSPHLSEPARGTRSVSWS